MIATMASYVERYRPEAVAAFQAQHPERFSAFADVSMRQLLPALVTAARVTHPALALSEAVRRIGRAGFRDTLQSSLLARVLFSATGIRPISVFRQGPRAFQMFEREGTRLTFHELTERHFRYEYQHASVWLDCYHVGIIEGVLEFLAIPAPTLQVARAGLFAGSIECAW